MWKKKNVFQMPVTRLQFYSQSGFSMSDDYYSNWRRCRVSTLDSRCL